MSTSYLDIANAVANYYGAGSDQWIEFSKYGVNSSNCYNILKQVPGVNVTVNSAGNVLDYSISSNSAINAESTIASELNSNVTTVATSNSVAIDVPATITADNTGAISAASGIGKTSAGATVTGVLGTVAAAAGAVAAGITLGEYIDKTLYSFNPSYWDSIGMSTLNPDTWSQITGDDTSTGAKIINALFHFNKSDNSSTMYMDENALAYYTGLYNKQNLFTQSLTGFTYKNNLCYDASGYDMPFIKSVAPTILTFPPNMEIIPDSPKNFKTVINTSSASIYTAMYSFHDVSFNQNSTRLFYLSSQPFTLKFYYDTVNYPDNFDTIISNHDTTKHGDTFYYSNTMSYTHNTTGIFNSNYNGFLYGITLLAGSNFINYSGQINNLFSDIWDIWNHGTSSTYINQNTGSTVFDPTGITDNTDIASILTKLKTQYPSLFENAISKTIPQPDGSSKTYTYVPVAVPAGVTTPYSGTSTQTAPQVSPASDTDTQTTVAGATGKTPDINGGNTGSGSTPVVVTPTGSASALYTVYNPTQTQLNLFGAWLWSSSFVDQIQKLFSDPMQAIIGLHKIYCNPSISGTSNIKVGYLDSGVSANVVNKQYTTIDCGSVSLLEKFGNVFDYEPYTSVGLYLPFIGVVRLNVADVMRATLNVVYHFDVLTGAIYVEVKVTRDAGAGGTIYTYSGNGASQYPLSSGSYMGIVSGIMSIAGGIAGTIASGGAAMPLMMGAASSAMNMHTNVERSGSITGNAGAMGAKIPYLIISRPQTAMADNYSKYTGVPANQEMRIGSASGFCKFLTLHLTNITATDAEKTEIQNLFESGVLI